MHGDALTVEGAASVRGDTLRAGDCHLQFFAAFLREKEGRFAHALALCEKFDKLCRDENFNPVRKASDIRDGVVNALLTVEEGGAIEGSLNKLETLYERGVRLMTLIWNYPNEIGYPSFPDYEGLSGGNSSPYMREKERGLTCFGRETVERMVELGMIVDVSHGSDKLVSDVYEICRRKGTFVASHSGAAAVCPWARNLEDGQIRMIADCGGVIGLDFCADFLSENISAEGQKEALLVHARHIMNVGGEDVLALGSDFDGIPENAYMKSPAHVPLLLKEFEKNFGGRIAEKIARKNALRVLKEVLK